MIQRKLHYFTFCLAILLAIAVHIQNWLNAEQQARLMAEHKAELLTAVAGVNLLLANKVLPMQHDISALLQRLTEVKGIKAWQLINNSNQIIAHYPQTQSFPVRAQKSFSANSQHFYFRGADKQLLTLNVEFNLPLSAQPLFAGQELLWVIVLVIAILLLGLFWFRWLYQLESYARYILANDNQPNQAQLERSSNPISQTINQLMLKNSLLLQNNLALSEQVRKISFVDQVTSLGNQLFFKAEFEVRLHNHQEQESGILMLLSFVDTDEKDNLVMDDRRLGEVADLLKSFIQDTPDALAAHLRAYDFALLLPKLTATMTDKLCKTLIVQLDKAIFDRTPIKSHFVDIGISAYKQGFDYYKIMAEADMALRNAQLQGGNNWFMYGMDFDNGKVRGKLKWRGFLQNVLDQRQILLFGQPVNYFDDSATRHIEILARIEDGKNLLTAETFLPMALECGLASEFDRQIIDGVIKHALNQEKEPSPMIYSVNLFSANLLDERFIAWLIAKLSSYPQLSRQLCFELKEGQINQQLDKMRAIFPQITQLGSSWCVEKMGSPDQDQTFLEILPIARVKIDRRYINNIHADKSQQLLLQSLLINLKSKKIKVIADGVEHAEDVKYLKSVGVNAAQGFYFDRPQRLKPQQAFVKAL